MEDLVLGNLIVTTSAVIPFPNRINGDYRYKTVTLHSYFCVERSECAEIKKQFLAHNRHLDQDDVQFTFKMVEVV
jgi:hypothetical protein